MSQVWFDVRSLLVARARVVAAAAVLLAVFTLAQTAEALIVPTACQPDAQGANDEPGQKDITRFCVDEGTDSPFDLHTIVNWDDVQLSGANTADICTLFDSDDDGFTDLAVCTTLVAGASNVTLGEIRLFRCADDKADRCTNSTYLPGPYTTTCEVTAQKTDPFSPAALNGPGDFYPFDTEILCAVDMNEFGLPGTVAVLLDACSYPSREPNSDPSDCVAFAECISDEDCQDTNVCTTDFCDHSGVCMHRPKKGKQSCNDGLYCNGDDTCNNSGLCEPSANPRNCSDGVSCTVDSCDELSDSCLNEARNTLCSDGAYCNGVEICHPVNGCQAGNAPNCSDNVGCTNDACDESTDSCTHSANDGLCSNNLYCDGTETCHATLGCQAGSGPDCNDNVSCTNDSCDESNDRCVNAPNNGACSDGQFCTGTEICDPVTGCEPGTTNTCNDGIDCTDDSCNEAADRCDNVPDNTDCDNGDFCDGNEVCDPADGCEPGADPCPNDLCNESTDQCVQCLSDADCNNLLFCDGTETCDTAGGVCIPGVAPNCTDAIGCTTDQCNEATDQCDHTPNDGACSDGQHCNGIEACSLEAGCTAGVAPDCDDGVTCTIDACDEIADNCSHTASDAACSNGLFCDGTETCDAVNDCQPAAAPDCDDGIPCTADSCNETTDTCNHAANNALCADDLFCNGTEICSLTQGCIAGSPIICSDAFRCSTDTCNETNDNCETDFSTCVCGDNEVTGAEKCDPPATAGTFEDCKNGIDDDFDGAIDCRDKSCKPNAREPLCDENCNFDKVCEKFIRDPATITFSRDGTPDVLYIHGRIRISGNPDPLTDGMTFRVANESSPIYRAQLGWGEMKGKFGGKKFMFKDNYARIFGQDSLAGGLASVRLKFRWDKGQPYLVFTLRAYGDMSAADHWLMTTEISVGSEVGFLTAEWTATPNGWKIHQTDF